MDFNSVSANNSGLSEKCEKLNQIIYIEGKLKGFQRDDAGNTLRWPIPPNRGISTFFHDPGYIKLFGDDHHALDIPANQGTPIKAPADGYVIHINPPKSVEYSFLALKHSDGIVTVYGHLSNIKVKELDFVKAGEVFAESGGSPGTKGAGLLTTGAHLHFEVWKDKKFTDPMQFLDISILSFNSIPSKFVRKYKLDFKARKGMNLSEKEQQRHQKEKTRTFKIEGKTEIDRQKNFLLNYGVGKFRDWSIWVEEGIDQNIDPTFMMCVGLAETSLGKHLKTPYNIGNVGNTDSGATKDFSSPRAGIRAMVQTFNNKYLGGYDEIQLLSRYGNKDKPIYASSPDNWHNNIVSCMSHIKGVFVPDDYNFRLQ